MSVERYQGAGFGIQTAAIAAGGIREPYATVVFQQLNLLMEQAWTSGGHLSLPVDGMLLGAGTQTAGLVAGGKLHHQL
jgi:hypothetical protein